MKVRLKNKGNHPGNKWKTIFLGMSVFSDVLWSMREIFLAINESQAFLEKGSTIGSYMMNISNFLGIKYGSHIDFPWEMEVLLEVLCWQSYTGQKYTVDIFQLNRHSEILLDCTLKQISLYMDFGSHGLSQAKTHLYTKLVY